MSKKDLITKLEALEEISHASCEHPWDGGYYDAYRRGYTQGKVDAVREVIEKK